MGALELPSNMPSRSTSDKMAGPEEPEPDGEEDDLTASGELRQRKKARTRQNFSWRQVSVLEQVFEIDPVPSPVRTSAADGLLALCDAPSAAAPPAPTGVAS